MEGITVVRILLIHAESFSYRAIQRAVNEAEPLERDVGGPFNNALVVFTTIESSDNENPEAIVLKAAEDIIDIANKVKASNIVLYPYAHLSSDLAPPSIALKILKLLESELRKRGIEVHRAPFGWYKEFTLKCFGHPLSELSREIRAEAEQRVKVEKKYYILTLDGELVNVKEYRFEENEEEFKALVEKEALGKALETETHGKVYTYLRKFGFEWEPSSDHGHLRYEPHATVMIEAVSAYAWKVANELGIPVFRIRGTNMFNLAIRAVKEHADLYGDRLYELRVSKDRLVLRYAACHQQFSILKDWVLSYKDLPMGMFEIADSYRYEQRGELVLGFRMRRFHMPDLHILTHDLEEAKKICLLVRDKIFEEAKKVNRNYWVILNVTEDFLNSHFEYLVELVKRDGRPALVTVYPAGIYYWVLNVEYNIIDELGRPREIATFQIDIGNAKRFGIKFRDADGSEKYPIIIHTAIIGSIERYIYMLFDTAAMMERKGKTPCIPTWVMPIQVRIIPIAKAHLDYAVKVAKKIIERGFRVDIDDRDESLGKRIREAGIEWIPYIVVIGDREVSTETINVRMRCRGMQKSMKVDELIELLEEEVKGYPRVESSMPLFLSRRPAMPYLREAR